MQSLSNSYKGAFVSHEGFVHGSRISKPTLINEYCWKRRVSGDISASLTATLLCQDASVRHGVICLDLKWPGLEVART